MHPDAGGVDAGNASHFAAVPPDRDPHPVRESGCRTRDLMRMAEWFRACGVATVAMQSTGVYSIPLYDILTQHGIRVAPANARHTKNVPGRKTDVPECQWLMKLHTYGMLLRDSFRLPENMETVRTLWRLREGHVREAGRAQTIVSEIGPDMRGFKTENHFTSWLGLTPGKDISGGKSVGPGRGKIQNRVAAALPMAATTLLRSQSYPGSRYRHLRNRLPSKKAAVKAMARYLAVLVYRLLTHGQAWVDRGAKKLEKKRAEPDFMKLTSRALAQGYKLVRLAQTS